MPSRAIDKKTRKTDSRGYLRKQRENGKQTREHVLVAEAALGRAIPNGAQIHHVNGRKDDNRRSNLVICQDQAYHSLLHKRQRALEVCGNPDWLKCPYCGRYDAKENLYIAKSGQGFHRTCRANYERDRYHRRRRT